MSAPRIAIIGASGFIGLRAVEWFHLGRRADVRPVVRSFSSLAVLARFDLPWQVADFLDPDSLAPALAGCDGVLHAAIGDAAQIPAMAASIATACTRAGVPRLVWLSSASVHGQQPPAGTDEASPIHDHHAFEYSNAKVRAERALAAAPASLAVTLLRPGVVHGPRSRWILDAARDLRDGTAWWIDGGRGICNAVYVDNLLAAAHAALTAPAPVTGPFLIGDAGTHTWRDFLLPVARHLGIGEAAFHEIDPASVPPHQTPSRWSRLSTSPLARRLSPLLPHRLRRLTKGLVSAWPPPHPPLNPWRLPAPPTPRPTAELAALFQCRWRLPDTRARDQLGFAPPVSFQDGIARGLAWLDFLD